MPGDDTRDVVVVSDTSVLIDLERGSLLKLSLPYRTCSTAGIEAQVARGCARLTCRSRAGRRCGHPSVKLLAKTPTAIATP